VCSEIDSKSTAQSEITETASYRQDVLDENSDSCRFPVHV